MSARLDRALTDCGRLANRALGPEGWFSLLVIDCAPGGMAGYTSNAPPDVWRRVVGGMVSARGESAVPGCPPPTERRRWMRDELPRLASAFVDMYPDMLFGLVMWFGQPEGLASVFVAANMSKDDVVASFGEWLEREDVRAALREVGSLAPLASAGGQPS